MDTHKDCAASAAVSVVLDALVRDDAEPGYLQKVAHHSEVLFRILCDADERKQERLATAMDTLAIVGEIAREVEISKEEGRFQFYP